MNNTLSNNAAAYTSKSREGNLSTVKTIRARIIKLFVALLLLSGVLLMHSIEPGELPLPACKFKSITGLPCPTCGITRSVHAAANLEFKESFIRHPFGLLLISAISVLFVSLIAEAITGRSIRLVPVKINLKKSLIGLVLVWGIYWLVKLSYLLAES